MHHDECVSNTNGICSALYLSLLVIEAEEFPLDMLNSVGGRMPKAAVN